MIKRMSIRMSSSETSLPVNAIVWKRCSTTRRIQCPLIRLNTSNRLRINHHRYQSSRRREMRRLRLSRPKCSRPKNSNSSWSRETTTTIIIPSTLHPPRPRTDPRIVTSCVRLSIESAIERPSRRVRARLRRPHEARVCLCVLWSITASLMPWLYLPMTI